MDGGGGELEEVSVGIRRREIGRIWSIDVLSDGGEQ
jgi:hypothetical protein